MNRFLSLGLAAGCAMLVHAGTGRADDVIRLGGGNVEATTQTLGFDGAVNTELMRGYHGGHHHGGYHHGGFHHSGYHHGGYHHGGYHHGGYNHGGYNHGGYNHGGYYNGGYYNGGYNHGGYYNGGYGASFYSPGFSASFYGRPYYSSYYYQPYYSYYRPSYYYGASYYYPSYGYPSYYPTYYYGCAEEGSGTSQTAVLGTLPSYRAESLPAPRQVMPPSDAGDGTYRYDGDPQAPLPMPGAEPVPGPTKGTPRPTLPRDGRLVSLPASTPYAFQAYGAQPTAKEQPAQARVVNATPSGARFAFPAYGEQPVAKR